MVYGFPRTSEITMTHSDERSKIECRTLMIALVEKKRGLVRSEEL